ncbi:MAG TPA: hypothetical protein VG103_10655 [Chthoniobacterales bacterium]|jgi:hypothetical protein|nr:hypothetical protein [Chthoniobacterales bacterium]
MSPVCSFVAVMSILLAVPTFAANPFLNAKDDRPVSASVRGNEWNDEYTNGEIPLTARMITTRIASMRWGAIFKIEFVDLKSRAEQKREIRPQYFIATDDRIFLLNEEDNDAAAKKISAMDKAPNFEQGDIRAIANGKSKFEEGPYTTEIAVKGDECTYMTSHDSGHYTKFVWKKGVGLVEHASNYGAMKDGFRLKRVASKK